MDANAPILRFADLTTGRLPGVTVATGAFFAEAARVCLASQGHPASVTLQLDGDIRMSYALEWEPPSRQALAAHDDEQDATEYGAQAVAFVVVLDATQYTVVRRARKGTGVDWFLGFADAAFQNSARLEVSGILHGSADQFESRVRQKLRQTWPTDGHGMPAYVSVTDFGVPRTRLVRKP